MKTQLRHLIIVIALLVGLLADKTAMAQTQNHFRNKQTGTEYATFKAAFNAATAGDTLVMLVSSVTMNTTESNIESNSTCNLKLNKNITISVRDDIKLTDDGYVTLDFSYGDYQNGIDITDNHTLTIIGNSMNKIRIADMSHKRYYFVVIREGSTFNATNVLIEGSKYGIFNIGGTVNLNSCKLGDATNTCIMINRLASTTNITNCMMYGKTADTATFKEPLIREGSPVTAATLQTELARLTSGNSHAIDASTDPTATNQDDNYGTGSGKRTININGDKTRIFGFKDAALYLPYKGIVLNFNDGHIYNCIRTGSADSKSGSAIYLTAKEGSPTCTMNGGTIESCFTQRGGAIGMMAAENTFKLKGGVLRNNVSSGTSGGLGGAIYLKNGKLHLEGGSIIENTAGSGGGIYMTNSSDAYIYVGAEGSNAVTVKGNTGGGQPNDIYLASGKYISVSGNYFNPQDVGIYTASTDNDVNVFYNSAGNHLSNLYNAIANGTKKVFPNRTQYQVKAYTSGNYIRFTKTGVSSPWSAEQRTATASDLVDSNGDGVYEIGNVKQLTAFLWYVNGIKTHITTFTATHPGANGILTANIDMTGHYWIPIGAAYTGTFDGNGYSITGLSQDRNNIGTQRGLFGTITTGVVKNLQLHDCNFTSGQALYMGLIAAEMSGAGTISNCTADGTLEASSQPITTGGLVGRLGVGEIHSSYAMPTFNGTSSTLGGLVGVVGSGASLKNSYTNATLTPSATIGGIVGVNAGTVENCYVRGTTSIVGTGSASNCYASTDGSDGDYTAVVKPYAYGVSDNLVRSSGLSLLKTLNNWVGNSDKYAKWVRPTTTTINGDYPVLKMSGQNAVAANSTAPTRLYYGDVNTLLTNHQTATDAIYLYESKAGVSSYNGDASLIIDEDAAITQEGPITASVGITLKNTQTSTDSWDWHMFSSALTAAPLGFDFDSDPAGSSHQYGFGNEPYHYSQTGNGYFPMIDNCYYREWDFYTYFEPQYHWINFKRNGNDHWHEDWGHDPIVYVNDPNHIGQSDESDYTNVNETSLIPGKGYLLATKQETMLQCERTLNNTDVSIAITTSGALRKGYNLIGNPYQSYYDFNTFADDNASLWSGSTPAYVLLSGGSYTSYAYNASNNPLLAPRSLHPHQGFMIIADNSGTATFYNSKRRVDGQSDFRDASKIDYPLVNLIATDGDGKRDITTVELGRPDKGGAPKVYDLHLSKGSIYTHYENRDYSIAFTQPGITSLNVWFEADEEAAFTLTWDTQNGHFDYLHLIDNMTGTDTDCLVSNEYHFMATPDDYKSRFRLMFGYTGIDDPEVSEPVEGPTQNFAFQMGDQIVVNEEGRLEIIDMLGRIIGIKQMGDGQNTIAKPKNVGVYLLRLTNAVGTQTQKIVIQ